MAQHLFPELSKEREILQEGETMHHVAQGTTVDAILTTHASSWQGEADFPPKNLLHPALPSTSPQSCHLVLCESSQLVLLYFGSPSTLFSPW